MIKHINLIVKGTVQGVFFRASTKEKAYDMQLTGFVRNEPDGSVYIEVEGSEQKLQSFVAWCHEGPARAQVTEVLVTSGDLKDFKDFQIYR